MRVLIAGVDGYIGWPLALHLIEQGHEVCGIDNGTRRQCVADIGSRSVTPIARPTIRHNFVYTYWLDAANDVEGVRAVVSEFKPDAVVNLAHIPSAPYSMIRGREWEVQANNLATTWGLTSATREHVPDCHFLTLGSMGEYGTPNLPIPEGYAEMSVAGRSGSDFVPFPRQPGSFYHAAKVHATVNLELACKFWGLRCTDVMQGVVFGVHVDAMGDDERLLTRLDCDEYFGTAINRFVCQALIGHPLTVYGAGGQTRGFLPLRDSIRCIELLLENPPDAGQHRVVNQLEDVYSISDLAQIVADASGAEVKHYDNPRVELEEHSYEVATDTLRGLGYEPQTTVAAEVEDMLGRLEPFADRIDPDVLVPEQRWDGELRKAEVVG